MRRIIFFDGICPLCNGFVNFVIQRDRNGIFLFSSLQSDYAKKLLATSYQSLDTIVLQENGETFFKSTAVIRILFQLGGMWNLLALFSSIVPRFFRDLIYDFVSKNRYALWGKNEVCRRPTPLQKKLFLE